MELWNRNARSLRLPTRTLIAGKQTPARPLKRETFRGISRDCGVLGDQEVGQDALSIELLPHVATDSVRAQVCLELAGLV